MLVKTKAKIRRDHKINKRLVDVSQVSDRFPYLAGEVLSASLVVRNYKPIYFSGGANLRNHVVVWKDTSALSPLCPFTTLSPSSERSAGASHCVFALFIDNSDKKHGSTPKKYLKLYSRCTVGKQNLFFCFKTAEKEA